MIACITNRANGIKNEFVVVFFNVLVLHELSMITLSHPYRKFGHGRKCDDLSTGDRKHPVKVTSLSADANLRTGKI